MSHQPICLNCGKKIQTKYIILKGETYTKGELYCDCTLKKNRCFICNYPMGNEIVTIDPSKTNGISFMTYTCMMCGVLHPIGKLSKEEKNWANTFNFCAAMLHVNNSWGE